MPLIFVPSLCREPALQCQLLQEATKLLEVPCKILDCGSTVDACRPVDMRAIT